MTCSNPFNLPMPGHFCKIFAGPSSGKEFTPPRKTHPDQFFFLENIVTLNR